jgi:S1-C subfamily serine protease
MARSGWIWAGLGSALLAMAGCTVPEASADDSSLVVQRATIALVPESCAGVIVGDERHAITSAHCIRDEPGGPQAISLYDGTHIDGTLTVVDRDQDIALIKLKEPAPVQPLTLADQLPKPGDEATFTSRMDQPGVPQQIQIQKLGRCPSLPQVPEALFTSLRGKPGDSGSPVVNPQLQVVGLVHGGARCSIAAPTADFAEELQAHVEADRMAEHGNGG